MANKSDILDRGLNIELEGIDENKVKLLEREILPEFGRLKHTFFHTFLTLFLRYWHLSTRLRVKEYEEIIARCMGFESFKFLDAYWANREKKSEVIMEEWIIFAYDV